MHKPLAPNGSPINIASLMQTILCLLTTLMILAVAPFAQAENSTKDTRVYEVRVYYAPPGKLDNLHARFRDHTTKLFAKHGIESIGYWTPINNSSNKLFYVLAYPNRDAREASWKAFMADPDWKKAWADSEKDGPIVYGNRIESYFLQATDFSPFPKAGHGKPSRVFELRTYTAAPGKLDPLLARFKNHTVKLFEKHGMTNIAYWTKMKDQKDSDKMLQYILAHDSEDAAKKSFAAFRDDADWVAAKNQSEKDNGGSLTVDKGVVSEFMVPTDYSPIQ